MTEPSQRRFRISPQIGLLAVFIVSRILYFAAGIRFDVTPLNHFFQIVDPLLMKTRLFETLLYLHTQPPGFNLLIGLVVKCFPDDSTAILHAVYIACGASLCWSLFGLMRIFEVRTALAFVLTALFLISPGIVLFENFLLYEYPLMALLCASGILFHQVLRRPQFQKVFLFFVCLMTLVYMRAVFQLVWFVILAIFLAWLLRGQGKIILAAATLPFALILALYIKNQIVAGSFNSSTWLGFNAESITLHQLTPEEHEKLIQEGILSSVGRIPATDPLSAFRGVSKPQPPTGIAVLDQEWDSTGRINYNNIAYLPLHRYYMNDAKQILLHYPIAYFRSVAISAFTYFLPSGDFPFFEQNGPVIERFNRIFDTVFFGQWKVASDRKELRAIAAGGHSLNLIPYLGTYLLAGLPLLFCFGIHRVWRGVRLDAGWNPSTALLAYLLFQIAWVTAVVCLLASFETNRYRLPVDPFYVVLLGLALERLWAAFRTRSVPA